MELVTDQEECERLEREMRSSSAVLDLVLDDGSLVPAVAVVGERALGVIVGGHTGFLPFWSVPQIHSRRVREALRLTPIHHVPLFGRWLRRRWARHAGASPTQPAWIPKL